MKEYKKIADKLIDIANLFRSMDKMVKESKKPVWNYPCYGNHKSGQVNYFTEPGRGTIVVCGYGMGMINSVGARSDSWIMKGFTPCSEPEKETLKVGLLELIKDTKKERDETLQSRHP